VTAPALPGPLWLIGCGNMGGAMLEGWLDAGVEAAQVTVVDPFAKSLPGNVRLLSEPPEDEVPALVLLSVKPQMLAEVAPAVAPALDPHSLLISVLAGVELASLRSRFPSCETIVRAMPNLAVRLRKGAIGLYSDRPGADQLRQIETLMAALGTVEWIQDEDLFHLVTALAGSGPAFLFRFIDALAATAAELGLPAAQAERLALATVEGAAALAAAAGEPPAALADRVASPGGTTRKGLDVLDSQDRLRALLQETLDAAAQRSRELAEAARQSG
jgi:pyrroline-5-carboxylate reductase